MEEFIVNQGQDAEFTFQFTDHNGAAINLQTATRVFIFLTYKNGTILEKYALPSQSGYKDITGAVFDLAAGIGKIKLLTTKTTTAEPGKIYAETRIKVADVNYTDDSQLDYMKTEEYVCTIKKSVTAAIALP